MIDKNLALPLNCVDPELVDIEQRPTLKGSAGLDQTSPQGLG